MSSQQDFLAESEAVELDGVEPEDAHREPAGEADSTSEEAPAPARPRIRLRNVVSLVLVGILLMLFNTSFSSSAYYKLSPGPAPEITSMVVGEIPDPSFGTSGRIHFTTIKVEETSWWEYVWRNVVPKDGVSFIPRSSLGTGDQAEQSVAAAAQMRESEQVAYAVAAQRVGVGAGTGEGAQIQSVVPGSAAERSGLTLGEVITSVDGTPVSSAEEAAELLVADGSAALVLDSAGSTREVDVALDPVEGKWALGVVLGTKVTLSGPPLVDFEVQGVGGPSAGLMFTLAFVDALSEGDLTSGKDLAGTGTINLDGTVGPISGIEDKVIGASEAGAEVFFSPASQASKAAESAPEGIEVVSVATYEDALTWLCQNGGESSVCVR